MESCAQEVIIHHQDIIAGNNNNNSDEDADDDEVDQRPQDDQQGEEQLDVCRVCLLGGPPAMLGLYHGDEAGTSLADKAASITRVKVRTLWICFLSFEVSRSPDSLCLRRWFCLRVPCHAVNLLSNLLGQLMD